MMAAMSRAVKMLLRGGWITKEQLDQAMVLSARQGETPGYHLVEMGAIADEDLVDFFVRHFSLRYWQRFRIKDIAAETVGIMTPALAKHLRVLPIVLSGQNLTLGLTDPSLTHVAEEAAFHTKRFINPVLISELDMTWALARYYNVTPGKSSVVGSKPPAVLERETHDLIPANLMEEASKIRAVINVTDGGWDIDEWGLMDLEPDEDNAIPLNMPKSQIASIARTITRPPPRPERPSIFSIPAPSRTTLPPPGLKVSAAPSVRHSIASMMLGESRTSFPFQAVSSAGETEKIRKSTEDFLIPKSIPHQPEAPTPAAPETREAESKKTISDIMDVIHRSADKDEIVRSALDFLLLFARRAAFMLVKKDEIRGYDIKGEDTNLAAFKSYWIPYNTESTFRKAAENRQIHLGPYGRTVSDAVFSAALGGRPHRVLVIPVVLQDRVAGLLYADNLRIDMPPWNLLERIAEVTGTSLYRLLMTRQKSQ